MLPHGVPREAPPRKQQPVSAGLGYVKSPAEILGLGAANSVQHIYTSPAVNVLRAEMKIHSLHNGDCNGNRKAPPHSSSDEMCATNCENVRRLCELRERHALRLEEPTPSTKLKVWLYPKLYWGLPPRGNISDVGTRFLQAWDVVLAACCLYIGFMVPFSLFFEKVYLRKGQCLFTNPDIRPGHIFYETRYVDVVVDGIFITDIFLNLVSGRWVLEAEPMEHWELYDDISTVVPMYLRDTFLLDFISSFPVQYIDCIPNLDIGAWKLFRLLRLLKLLRLYRLDDFFKMIHFRFPGWIYLIAVVKLSITFLLVAHLVASAFFYMSYGLADPKGDEQEQYGYFNGWVFNDGILDEEGEPVKHAAGPWLSSFYWAVTTMSTIGYGDISATTSPERILGMGLMIVGCCFFAYITGNVTQLLSYKAACEQRFEDIVSDLETFMIVRGIPHALRKKLRSYYMVRYPSGRILNDDQIIANIESPFLKKDILIQLYKDLVALVPVFALMDGDTQREIAFRLKNIYRMPGRIITEEQTEPDALYIVRFGTVSLQGNGMKEQRVHQGDIFGEMALLGLTKNGLRMRTAKAVTVVELCSLSAEDFKELLVIRPGMLVLIREVCKLHLLGLTDMYKRAVDYRSRSDEKDVPVFSADLFHEATRCVNWRDICLVIKENLNKEMTRTVDSKVDEKEIVSLENQLGVKLVKRMLRFSFSSLVPAGKIAKAADQYGIIVAWWPGYGPGEVARQGETDLFHLKANKRHNESLSANKLVIGLVDEILLPILSPQGMHLSKLPPVQIAVLIAPRKSSNESTLVDSLGAKMKLLSRRELESTIVPSAQIVFQGSLSLSELKESKGAYGSRSWLKLRAAGLVSTDRPVVANTLVSASSEYNPSNANETVLEFTAQLQHHPRCQGWKKLLPLISSNMVTPWFIKKMQATIHKLEDQHSVVMSQHLFSRIANLRVYRQLNPGDSSEGAVDRDKYGKGDLERNKDSVIGTLVELRQDIKSGVGEGRGEDVLQKLLAEIQSMKTSMQSMSMTRMVEIQSMKTSMQAMSMSISDLRGEVRKVVNRNISGEF
jgi:CRP-like cAMP-binding protein